LLSDALGDGRRSYISQLQSLAHRRIAQGGLLVQADLIVSTFSYSLAQTTSACTFAATAIAHLSAAHCA
jgi:hypothetical protein